jgi:hypothetical protein
VLAEVLRALPETMELGHPAAEERLYPGPGDADDGRLAEDWKAYVEPDLQQTFGDARQAVAADVHAMKETDSGLTLRIPYAHYEAWISVLTQVRLAIAAVHKLEEEDLARTRLPEIKNARDAALHRMHLYGLLSESIIQAIEDHQDFEEFEDLDDIQEN